MKKCLIALIVAVVAVVSQASVLQWQVSGTDLGGSSYNFADLYAVNDGGALMLGRGAINTLNSHDVSAYTDYSFYVELINYANGTATTVGVGETVAYGALAQDGYITGAPLSQTMAQVWHGGTKSVPEPTSGFLMMVGLALLGLKRRKV